MPRLSITLTDKQAEALEAIAAETGATKQSMIGLAITDWIVQYLEKQIVVMPTTEEAPQQATEAAQKPAEAENDQEPTTDENEPEKAFTVIRTTNDVEVAWLRGRWEDESHKAIICTAHKLYAHGELHELGRARYELTPIMRVVEGPAVGTEEFRQWATSE